LITWIPDILDPEDREVPDDTEGTEDPEDKEVPDDPEDTED
jgi:hypothetical protein